MTADDPLARLSFVVIGAQKAASTAVANALGRHADVFVPARELPLFEGRLFTAENRRAAARVFATRHEAVLGMKRPDLLLDPDAPSRIAETSDRAIAVAALRDPVGRAISAYWWYMQAGLLPVQEQEAGLRELLDRSQAGGWSSAWPRASEVLQFGCYGLGLERYLATLGRERVVVLLPEDLGTARWRTLLADVLGLGSTVPELERENPTVYSIRRTHWLRTSRRLLPDARVADYHRLRASPGGRIRWQTARAMNLADRAVLARVWPSEGPPALSADLQARLRSFYAPDRDQLVTLLGRAMPW